MNFNAKIVYMVLSGLIVLALLTVGGSVYLAEGFLKKKSQDVHDARLNALALEEKLSKLKKAKADIEKYGELAEISKSIVPQDKDQARTVREISNLAEANGIKLGS